MKIAINGSSLLHPSKTGVELYVKSLLENIKNLPQQQDFEFTLYYPASLGELDSSWVEKFPDNWQFKAVKWPIKYFWTQLALAWQLWKDKPDVFFAPAHVIPALYKGKSVMTIHDLAFKYFKDAYSPKELRYQEWAIKSAKKKGAYFIVPSQTTFKDLHKFYNIDKERIALVYHGFAAQEFTIDQNKESLILDKYGLTAKRYFFSLGRVENKKNTLGTIKAFEALLNKYEYKDLHLVLVGKGGYGFENIVKVVKESKYKEKIHLLGYLPNQEVSALLLNAYAFVFPSFYEGFGFPILEAMSCKIPVITSDYGVMAEIAEGSALLVNPKNQEAIVKAMRLYLEDKNSYDYYVKAGLEKYEEFTWQRASQETLLAFTNFFK